MDSMYEILLGLPIFAGVSHQKISDVVGKYKFHFLKFNPGDTIVSEGELCTHMKCVITGSVKLSTVTPNGKLTVEQTISAPDLITPDFFFGRTTHYPASVKAIDNVGILQLDKKDFINIINSDKIFLLNYLNILSMNAQLSMEGVLSLTSGELEKRIAYGIIALTQNNGKDIRIKGKLCDLQAALGVNEQQLRLALNTLTGHGIITFSKDEVSVLNRRELMNFFIC